MVLLGILGVGLVYLFLPKGRVSINGRMFGGALVGLLLLQAAITSATACLRRTLRNLGRHVGILFARS